MEPFRDDADLIAELRALRPAPRPAFAAELDERAAAGFPRRAPSARSPISRLVARLREVQPRRALIPAGATALAAIAAVTVIVAVGENGVDTSPSLRLDSAGAGSAASPPAAKSTVGRGHSAGAQFEASAPTKASESDASAVGTSAQSAVGASSSSTGPYASQAPKRDVERSAEMVLGTDPADVGKAAARVFEAVHTYHGIVLRSSIRDGAEGEAGARFDLLIPSARLGDALAAFSAIAEVRSRHEATADITAPTVGVGERLQDSRAKIESLLAQLAAAQTDAERAVAETRLRSERRHAAALRSQLLGLQRRAHFSRVSLRIETGAESAPSAGNGGWGVGDALGDAGHILAIAAGVTIVGLAILAPIALIAALAWLANRTRVHRSRQRALG